jgi:hypothetical protein
MTPAGYMAKHVSLKPDYLKATQVQDIYSVSACISDDFADYISLWKHNGYWLFDSREVILAVARENSIDLTPTTLFYYEVYEMEFDGKNWNAYAPNFAVNVTPPARKKLEGFDVVTFFAKSPPECSPLSCNSIAEEVPTNTHCLLTSFGEAEGLLDKGVFNNSEPGPYRIFSVYSVDWT